MKPRDVFLAEITRQEAPRPAIGSATSIVTMDLMDQVGASFPEGHLDVEQMVTLAAAGYTQLGYDNVMPLFGVWHESAALGCPVDWGRKDRMPDCSEPLSRNVAETVAVPSDLLSHPGCAVPLAAIGLLKIRYITATGIDCFHFDSKVPTAKARELAGDAIALMGGTSNLEVVRQGTPETVAADVAEKLAHRIEVIGPECAVPLDAPCDNLKLIAEEVKIRLQRRQP